METQKACDERIGPKVYLEPKWLRCVQMRNKDHGHYTKVIEIICFCVAFCVLLFMQIDM